MPHGDSAVVAISGNVIAHQNSYFWALCTGAGRLTPSGSTVYQLEYYTADEQSGNGLGNSNGNSQIEVYSTVEIYKEA